MGYKSGGMIFPFKGNSEEIIDLINSWTKKDFKILEANSKANETIELEFIQENLVIIHNYSFFFSASQEKDLWHERLKKSSLNNWVIFFECVDSRNAVSYLIFKNNIEVRRVSECEDQIFYQDGEPQDFEKEWLNASIGYEHEYKEGDEWKVKVITDPNFSLDDIDEWENYFKFYYVGSIDNYTNHLAKQLLSDLSNKYLGFDFINDFYEVEKRFTLSYEKISDKKKSFFHKILFWK
jgi:hypothetical protein